MRSCQKLQLRRVIYHVVSVDAVFFLLQLSHEKNITFHWILAEFDRDPYI